MKILRIHIKNLNSLNVEKIIDFAEEPLANTGLFAIIGPTGSGKSTILDAVSLALYGQIPRAGHMTDKNMEKGFILSRNSKDCYAAVDYEINKKQYRSKWSISINRNGNLNSSQMELAILPSGKLLTNKKSEVPAENEKIIGLNYSQFAKSVVLSQGEFAEFLKTDKKTRSELLEKITGTEIYRQLGVAAYEKNKVEKEKLLMLEQKIAAFDIIPDTIINQKKEEIEQIQRQNVELTKNINQNNISIQLKKDLKSLNQKYETVNLEKTQNNDNFEKNKIHFNKLKEHNKLAGKQKSFFEIKQLNQELTKLNEKLFSYYSQKTDYLTGNESLKNKLNAGSKELQNIKKKAPEFREIIKKTIDLDYKIKETENQIADATSKFDETNNELHDLSNKINVTDRALSNLSNKIKISENFLSKNAVLESLNNKLPSIYEKIKTFNVSEKKLISQINESKKYSFFNDLIKKKSPAAKNEFISDKKINVENKITELRQTVSNEIHDLPNLRDEKEKKQNQYREIEKVKKIQEESNIALAQKLKNENIVSRLQSQIKKLTKDIEKFDNEILIISKLIEELEIRLEREQLEAKYKDDRLKLKPNKPCFLCGSESHPYVKNYKNTFDRTKQNLMSEKKNLEKLFANLNTIKENKAELESERKFTLQNIANVDLKITNLSQEFDAIAKNNNWNFSIDNIKFANQINNDIVDSGKQLKKEIENIEEIQKQTAELERLNFLKSEIEDIINIQNSIDEEINHYSNYTDKNVSYKEKFELLSKINSDYLTAKESKQNSESEISKNQILKKELDKQKLNLKQKLKIQKSNLENLSNIISNFKSDRYGLLGNSNPNDEESKFNDKIAEYKEKLSSIKQLISAGETNLKNVNQNIETAEREIQEADEKISELSKSLLPEIQKLGYESIEEAQKYILEENEASKIRAILKELDTEKEMIENQLKNIITEIEKKKEEDKCKLSVEELVEQTQKLIETEKLNTQKNGALQNEIKENNKRKIKINEDKNKLQAQKKEAIRWEMLNQYIGDAKGNKFSAFAQELTLVQLLKHANKHLKMFTDRYLLKKRAVNKTTEEDLLIVDTYLANNERSVATLSGGESFLASLALALGLSDLAGGKTKLESLFIDEGFGALDQESLDEALNSLEKLQMKTNRTIGIISHVQALKERIKTQIELKPTSSGYSTLAING